MATWKVIDVLDALVVATNELERLGMGDHLNTIRKVMKTLWADRKMLNVDRDELAEIERRFEYLEHMEVADAGKTLDKPKPGVTGGSTGIG